MSKLVLVAPWTSLDLDAVKACSGCSEILYLSDISDISTLPNDTDFLLPTNSKLELRNRRITFLYFYAFQYRI